ncbi:hypothetical protein [Algoriella sp.]|uniref:hypothetical protein n=1 Tax=Algoriella sp. TaxID=1872434 RepID=UPI002FC5D17E
MNISKVQEIIKNQSVPSSYQQARDVYYAITLHTKGARPAFKDLSNRSNNGKIYPPGYIDDNYQNLFEKFLLSRHPREEEVTRDWRYSQYKPLTKSAFQRLINVVRGLIYQDTKHTLKIDDKENSDYLEGNNFLEKNNFLSLFKNIFLQTLFEDPNGYLVVIPSKHKNELQNNTNPLEVSFNYVSITKILHQDDKDLIFKSNDDKHIFWINEKDIIRFRKNEKSEWTKEDGYFHHDFGYIPAIRLGGIFANNGFYKSFVDDAIPIADEFISSYSSEQLIDKEASHPYIQQATVECPTCNGIGSTQADVEICDLYPNGVKQVECKTCHGKKQISINPAERYEVPVEEMDKQMVKIINPDVGINQYHRNKNKDIFNSILDALNLLKVDEAQSGLAKTIDRDNLYQFTSSVSDRLFELKDFCLKCFISYRSPDSKKVKGGYTLQKPYKFETQNAQELLDELSTAQSNGTPIHVRKYLINEFVNKRYKGNDVDLKINQIYANLDKTFGLTLDEIKLSKELGLITDDNITESIRIKNKINSIIIDKSKDYIRTKSVEELIKEINIID